MLSIANEVNPLIFRYVYFVYHVHKSYHAYHPNQMHVHVIMHDLPHLPHITTTPMLQCMFMFM